MQYYCNQRFKNISIQNICVEIVLQLHKRANIYIWVSFNELYCTKQQRSSVWIFETGSAHRVTSLLLCCAEKICQVSLKFKEIVEGQMNNGHRLRTMLKIKHGKAYAQVLGQLWHFHVFLRPKLHSQPTTVKSNVISLYKELDL